MIKLNLNKNYSGNIALLQLLKDQVNSAIPCTNLKLQIFIQSNVNINLIDNLSEAVLLSTCSIEFVLLEKSQLNYLLELTKFKNMENLEITRNLEFRLVGEGAFAEARILVFGQRDQKFKFKTVQNHLASQTCSNLIVKGVFDDKATFFCDNLIKIEKDFKKVYSKQINKNILLGKSARAISIPKLEVESDDVKCSHGAAVSKLNDEHIFYLQSRGLSKYLTKKLLVNSFLR